MASSLQVKGVTVHLEGEGAQTILMLHGWPDTYRLWDGQVPALANGYRCARFTLPGFSIEQAAQAPSLSDMIELIEAIAQAISPNAPLILMLHDWGCFYGYQFAAQHPGRVARIIGVDIGDTTSPAYLSSLSARQKLSIVGYQLWLAIAYHLGPIGTRMSRWVARLMQCKVDFSTMSAQQNYPYWQQWTGGFSRARRFTPSCPMLYLYGSRKPFMFHSNAWLELLANSPGSRARGFPTGHWVMLGDPQAFNREVRTWLDQA